MSESTSVRQLLIPLYPHDGTPAPQDFNADDYDYVGFLLNEYGEQTIFVREYLRDKDGQVLLDKDGHKEPGLCYIYMGDARWAKLRVVGGMVPGLMMMNGYEERLIHGMWLAATYRGNKLTADDLALKDRHFELLFRKLRPGLVGALQMREGKKQTNSMPASRDDDLKALLQQFIDIDIMHSVVPNIMIHTDNIDEAAVAAYKAFVVEIGNSVADDIGDDDDDDDDADASPAA
jgi:hypothetical protein